MTILSFIIGVLVGYFFKNKITDIAIKIKDKILATLSN